MIKNFKYKVIEFLVENVNKRFPVNLLPAMYVLFIDYFITYGRILNLTNPKRFSEKMQWIKIYGNLERYSDYADKYKVRDYVKKTIGKKYLIPLLGVWDKFEDIDFSKLPDKFVLKGTHGSGCNFICTDKSKIDFNRLKIKINKWLKSNYYENILESQYKNIKPRIICEKYMEDDTGGLTDYKFLCYHGKPKYIDIHLDRFTNHRTLYLDINWKRVPFHVDIEPETFIPSPPKPKNFKEMLKIAAALSKGFLFSRIDLYSVKGKAYFGEITFVPANGLLRYSDDRADILLGKNIKLSKFNKNQNIHV